MISKVREMTKFNSRRFSIAAAALAVLTVACATLLPGPSEADTAQASAQDAAAAKLAAQRFARDLRACKRALGPSADLVETAHSGDFVCREMPVEPTPEKTLRFAAR